MFACLVGGKFSGKCKHAVKCIKSRNDAIRKKKKATVRFLKKDVADLLAAGHDSNAFGRMDVLISEMNQAYCYEMIEKYCDLILNLLPSLRKQRECPEVALGVVSTLIYAAARFPDLPELCDLRHIFAERYGGHMESFVNAEFVDKIQTRSFSKEKKLQLMQSIADEFSVGWDCWAFERRAPNSPAVKYEQPREVESLQSANDATPLVQAKTRKDETLPDKNYEPTPRTVAQRQVQTELKDNMLSAGNTGQLHATAKKTRKATTDEIENVEPHQANMLVSSFDDLNAVSYSNTSKVQEKQDQCDSEKQGVLMMKSWNEKTNVIPPSKSKGSKNNYQLIEKTKSGLEYDTSSQRHRDWLEHTGKERQPMGPVNNKVTGTNMVPPYVKPKVNHLTVTDDYWRVRKPFSISYDKPHDIYDNAEDVIFGDKVIKSSSMQMKSQRLIATETYDRGIHEEKLSCQTPRHQRRHVSRQISSINGECYDEGKTRTRHPREHIDDEMRNQGRNEYRQRAGANGEYYDEWKTRIRHPSQPNEDVMDNQRQTPSVGTNDEYFDERKSRTSYQGEPVYDELDTKRRHRSRRSASSNGEYYDEKNIRTRHPREPIDVEMDNRGQHTSRWSTVNNGEYYDEGKTRTRFPREPIYDEMGNRQRHTSRRSAGNNGEYYDEGKIRARSPREPIYDEMDNQRRRTSRRSASNSGKYYDEGHVRPISPREPIYGAMDNRGRHTSRQSTGINREYYDEGKTRARRHPREVTGDEMDIATDSGELMPRTPAGCGRNGGRHKAPIFDEEHEDEEMVMDKLLIHYSKKGTVNERIHKGRRSRTPLRDHVLDSDFSYHVSGALTPGRKVAARPPKRTVSLPSEPVGSSEVSKVPARSATLQPDSLSPNGRRVHPRLPEYDDLAAHFTALKKA
ncbi:hypothetical protein Cni_G02911 [Canna indica]|uniref:IST1-like protein n=1 Tax=Canna indica TaxID=4628 RepID=A0AAQ3Q2V4_9LILI|nr:hypothetical protein Cni_G02911 [Canna indica]